MESLAATHPCPVPGCTVTSVPYGKLLCYPHWDRVPAALKAEVYRTWANGRPTPDYIYVRARAIAAARVGGRQA